MKDHVAQYFIVSIQSFTLHKFSGVQARTNPKEAIKGIGVSNLLSFLFHLQLTVDKDLKDRYEKLQVGKEIKHPAPRRLHRYRNCLSLARKGQQKCPGM
jgi:hypothetical protein